MQKYLMVTLFILITISQISLAEIPQSVTYQGVLTDTNGNILPNGTYNMQFTFYDAAENGNVLSSSQQIQVTVQNGTFTAELPSDVIPINWLDEYWVSLNVNGYELSPRLKMTSSPKSLTTYSLHAQDENAKISIDPAGLVFSTLDGSKSTEVQSGVIVLAGANNNQQVKITANEGVGGSIKINDQDGTQRFLIDQNALTFPDGSVQTSAASGGWIDDGDAVRLSTESDKVGIGTNTPTSKLYIKGATADSTASALNVTDSNDKSMLFARNDGKIGIGTVSPKALLDVNSEHNNGIFITDKTSNSMVAALLNTNQNGYKGGVLGIMGENNKSIEMGQAPSANSFVANFVVDDFSIINNSNGNEFTFNVSNGKVSVGVTESGQVISKMNVRGATADSTASALNLTNSDNNPLLFIRNDGKIGIGNNAPQYKLDIAIPSGDGIIIRDKNSNIGRITLANVNQSGLEGGAFEVAGKNDKSFFVGPTSSVSFVADYNVTEFGIRNGVAPNFYVGENKVSIGRNTAQYKFEVAGSNHSIALTDSSDSFNKRAELSHSSGYGGFLSLYNDSEQTTAKINSFADASGIQAYFTEGNVGIGLNNPASRLTVKGSTNNNSASALNVTNSDNNSLLFIRNDGLVGIGTASPGYKLHVNGEAYIQNTATVWGNSTLYGAVGIGTGPIGGSTMLNIEAQNELETKIRILNTYEDWDTGEAGKSAIEFQNSPATWFNGVDESGKFYIGRPNSKAMVINSYEYVGIGIEDPTAPLHVDGTIKTTALSVSNTITCSTLSATGNITTIAPSEPTHAATKAYVDAVAGSREEIDELFELIEELQKENQTLKARLEAVEAELKGE
jgi:hypothetical protein